MTNAATLVRQLNSEQIRNRLEELEAERKALMVLLRASQASDRGKQPKNGGTREK